MEDSLRQNLSLGAAEIGLTLDPAALDLFSAYQRELLLWNQRINLVSDKSSREIVIRHFLDSLTVVPWIARPEGMAIDLGSGAGFPGIPLQIALPQLQMTLVESSRKKSSFLQHIVRTLGLSQITVIRERVEALIGEKSCAGSFDTVVSRAAFKLPELIRTAAFFLKPGGLLIAMKGPDPQEEMAEAGAILDGVGMAHAASHDIPSPLEKIARKIVIYQRVPR
ncbi:MAG: 16S rRNA (guanine(527)-N(7))-methyltransferase RsmG [Deltaproteobacteria bacterium]|nr:16S rRNA (guanine(527)-N(7))-methyltransferase RsmG [Deltaproteobacteria bacterium]